MQYIEVDFCQQPEFGESADASNINVKTKTNLLHCHKISIITNKHQKYDTSKRLITLRLCHECHRQIS